MSSAAKVGVFMLIILAILGYFVLKIEDIDLSRGKGTRTVKVLFDNVAGLDEKSAVRVAGVRKGKVSKIRLLDDGKAEVTLEIDNDVPLSRACLLGCGVTTGWGSAVNTANVVPGDVVLVMGCGGIGSGAIQGARLAGAEHIVVVDIEPSKRDKAFQFGATHFATSMEEATQLVGEITRGVMADSAILTPGVLEGAMINDALNAVRKGGAVVVTALASMSDVTPTLPLTLFTLFQKRLLGSLYGEANPRADIPRLISLYRSGKLLLDETVTTEYKLNDINEAYDDMLAGRNIRGVIIHEH